MNSEMVSAALDGARFRRTHLWAIVIIGLGSLFEVVELSMTGVFGTVFADDIRQGAMTSGQLALLLATASIGAVIGSPLLGALGDRVGRRPALAAALGIATIFSIWGALCSTTEQLIAARLGASLGIGAYIPLAATYLADVIPQHLRGRALMSNAAIAGIGGIVCGFLTRWFGALEPFGLEGWRCTMLAGSVGTLAVALLIAWLPESPRWLMARGRSSEVMLNLARFVPDSTAVASAASTTVMAQVQPAGPDGKIWTRTAVGMLALLVVLHFATPWCTTGYTSFTGWVFKARGYDEGDALALQGIIMVGVSGGALLSMLFVDRIGRMTLLFWNAVVIALAALAFMSTASVYVALASGFVMAMAGAIYMWMLILWGAEAFPPLARAKVSAVLYSVNRGSSMLVPFVMLPLLTAHGEVSLYGTIAVMFGLSALLILFAAVQTGRAGPWFTRFRVGFPRSA